MSKLEELINKLCPNGVEFKKLSELMTPNPKSKIGAKKAEQMLKGEYPFYTSGKSVYYINEHMVDGENIFVNDGGQADIKYYDGKSSYADHVISFRPINVNGKYLYYVLMKKKEYINEKMFRGSGIKNINKNDFFNMLVPVPPLEVQCEIVRILDNFTLLSAELSAELSARQKQYEYYKNLLLKNYDGEDNTCLKDIAKYSKDKINANELNEDNYIGVDNLLQNKQGKVKSSYIPKKGNSTKYQEKDILIGNIRPYLKKIWLADNVGGTNGDVLVIRIIDDNVIPEYLYFVLSSDKFFNYNNINSKGAKMPRGDKEAVMNYKFYLPLKEEQLKIINKLNKFKMICNDLSEGLPAEIEARKKQYEYYRDKLLTFKELK
ncbi:restriction endonuclease subunit S [Campylobacter devanensis]|uniref:restriction endonuclease subunit S n=1 Tax=Campylobacter devanensis TaxID=3161138 RepID=UPI000A34FDB5|nr:restriction endonuclease subunit S [Campylobacter sp. P162]